MERRSESRGCCSLALFYLLGRFANQFASSLSQMINEARKSDPRTIYRGGMSLQEWNEYRKHRDTTY